MARPTVERLARLAYEAFVENAREYLPPNLPASWEQQHSVVRRAWEAAVGRVLDEVHEA